MPPVSLRASLDGFSAQTQALQNLVASLPQLSAMHQKLVAEIVLIRLCLLLENTLESACAKVLCGAQYLDSTSPQVLVTARSAAVAFSLMKKFGRSRPLTRLSWTRSKTIRKNMNKTLASGDALLACVSRYSNFFTEIRQVRNHIAHKSASSAVEFRKAVRRRYGALRHGMTPGFYLLHQGVSPLPKLAEYLITSRVLVRELLRG